MGFVGASEEATKTCVDKNELKQCFINLKDNKDLLKVKQNIQGAGIDRCVYHIKLIKLNS